MNQDLEHLRLLSIFHYVVAGIMGLFSCIPLIHFFIGLLLASGIAPSDDGARFAGIFFMFIGGAFILVGWSVTVLVFFAGRCLAQRSRYTFCLVIAAVECLFMPMGTILGVFTIVVLMRESVKTLFDAQEMAT